jgi:hypothetical protein
MRKNREQKGRYDTKTKSEIFYTSKPVKKIILDETLQKFTNLAIELEVQIWMSVPPSSKTVVL